MTAELRLRIISGIVMAAVVLVATWQGGIFARLLAAIVSVLVWYEWSTVTGQAARNFLLFAAGWIISLGAAALVLANHTDSALIVVAVATLALGALSVAQGDGFWLPGGIAYAGLTGVSLAALRGDSFSGLVLMLYLFAVVWGTDIAAYFTGRAIGGPKLAPAISPGKTWSGAIGGAVAAVILGTTLALSFGAGSLGWIVVLSLVLSVFSQIGDLFESFIKRKFGVKDSSHLIPGHGGVMDRVDGLVFACFAAFLFAFAASHLYIAQTPGTILLGLADAP